MEKKIFPPFSSDFWLQRGAWDQYKNWGREMVPSYDDVMRMLVPSDKLMSVKELKLEKEEITKETQVTWCSNLSTILDLIFIIYLSTCSNGITECRLCFKLPFEYIIHSHSYLLIVVNHFFKFKWNYLHICIYIVLSWIIRIVSVRIWGKMRVNIWNVCKMCCLSISEWFSMFRIFTRY